MYQRILVPLDIAQKNHTALAAAAELTFQHDARVMLLHVIDQVESVSHDELRSLYHDLEQKGRRELAAAALILKEQGCAASVHVAFGRQADVVIRFANEYQSDLIILRSHCFTPHTAAFPMETLTHQLAVFAQCAVLLVK